jgi:hypothetical protein
MVPRLKGEFIPQVAIAMKFSFWLGWHRGIAQLKIRFLADIAPVVHVRENSPEDVA